MVTSGTLNSKTNLIYIYRIYEADISNAHKRLEILSHEYLSYKTKYEAISGISTNGT